jgi:hypothetical protein
MTLLKDPPDLSPELRSRLAEATAEVAALAPAIDRAVAVYREAWAVADALPADDREFYEALTRFECADGLVELGAALNGLRGLIGNGL